MNAIAKNYKLVPFYLHSLFISSTKVIMPYYVLYFLEKGYDIYQIGIITAVRSVISILAEVPTGVIADKFGRKNSVLIGYLLTAISLFIIPFATDFKILIIIFSFNALFETLISGADQSWAVDYAKKNTNTPIDHYFLNTRWFRNVGLIVSPLIAAVLVKYYDMNILWFVFAVGIILSALFLLIPKDVKGEISQDEESKAFSFVSTHLKQVISSIRLNPLLMLAVLAVFIYYIVDEFVGLIWTPRLEDLGLQLSSFGYLYSIIGAIGIIIPLAAKNILRKKTSIYLIVLSLLLTAFAFIAGGSMNNIVIIAILFIVSVSMEDVYLPLEESLTNKLINNSSIRATLLSTKTMLLSIASIVGSIIGGLFIYHTSQSFVLIVSGVLVLVSVILYLTIKNGRRFASANSSQR